MNATAAQKTTTAAEATEIANRQHAAFPVNGTQTVRSAHVKFAGAFGVVNLRRTDGTWPGYDGALPWSVLSGPYGGPFQLVTYATAEAAVERFNAIVAQVCASCGADASAQGWSGSEECRDCHRESVARGGDEPCPCALCA